MTAIILSILAVGLYRCGGGGSDLWVRYHFLPKWLFDTKARDVGVPLCMLTYFAITAHWRWILVLCFGLMFGAQTSYFKKKRTDAQWYNWVFVGLAFSICMLPYAWATGHWMGFLWRTLIVTCGTVAVSELSGKDFVEEFGRGAIQIATLPLLLI